MSPSKRERTRGRGRQGRPGGRGAGGRSADAGRPARPARPAGAGRAFRLGPSGRSVPRALVVATGAIVAVALVAGGLFVVVRSSGSSTASCDPDASGWNGAGGGPQQTGFAPVTIHDPGAGWTASWQYPLASAPASDRVVAPPTEAGGSVYTATSDGTLVALDARTGQRQWTSPPDPAEQGVVQTPAALDGCAAVLATSFNAPSGELVGALRAVDLRTHQRRWAVRTADQIFSPPQIVDGVGYAGLSFAPSSQNLDRTHVLDGYYLSDGSRAYRKRFAAAVFASPTSDHERIWIGDLDQNLYALGSGGRQLWTYTTGGIVSLPAIYDGSSVVVASADHRVASLDPASGRERWNVEVGEVQAAMAEVGGAVVVATVDGRVRALGAADGKVRWERDLGAKVSRAVVGAGDRVFAVDDDGVLHVLDAATGAETASWTAPAPPVGSPAIAAGHLYLTCSDGRLYALPL
jgi:outer membrane protein assembly factor BamB